MVATKLAITTFLISLLLIVGYVIPAQSADLYQRMGVIDTRKLEKGSVIIYDVEYTLEPSTPVYKFDKTIDNTNPELRHQLTQQHLTPGTRVGYTVTYPAQTEQGKITEIWILPNSIASASEAEG